MVAVDGRSPVMSAAFAPLGDSGRADMVVRRVAEAVTIGLMADGEQLPSESDLACQLGVANGTVREALAILRELGPVLTAILVGGKVASGITAELGSMRVTEQIDALRTLGVNYIKRLVVPRVLAALVVFPLLTVLADAVGVLGGMAIMFVERGADVYAYWNVTTYWVVPKDFLTGIGKSVFFGVIVTLIGCYNGLNTQGGTEGLGRATTATVVHVTMGVIVSDFFLTKLFLTLFY